MLKKVLFAMSAAVIASTSHAAMITETTDFNGNLNFPSDIGTLDVGANSVSGSVDAECDILIGPGDCITFGDEQDAVEFLIPTGNELTSATLTISDLVGIDAFGRSFTDLGFLGFSLGEGVFDILGGTNLTGTQNYQVGVDGFDAFGQVASASWRLDLTVAPISAVPLPAGMSLLLAGLGAFGFARRQQRKSN